MRQNYTTEKCIICSNLFRRFKEAKKRSRGSRRIGSTRPARCKTCSSKCSRENKHRLDIENSKMRRKKP